MGPDRTADRLADRQAVAGEHRSARGEHESRGSPFRQPQSTVPTVIAVGLLVAVLFFPSWYLVPRYGLDPSWMLGLSWAQHLGLDWGPDVAFAYGPLGWTAEPMAFSRGQLVVSLLLHVAGTIVAVWVADDMAEKVVGLARWPALLVAAIATALCLVVALPITLVVVMFASVAMLVGRGWWPMVLTAVSLGVLGHQKLSEAVIGAVFALLCAFGGLGWRGAGALVAVSMGTWLALWLGLGHGLANLPEHIANSLTIISGYAGAMNTRSPGFAWQLAAAGLMAIMLVAQALEVGRTHGRRRQVSLLAATVLAAYLMLRAGFTRHDEWHLFFFTGYAIVLGAALVLGTAGRRRHSFGIGVVVVAFCLQAMVVPWGGTLRPIDRTWSLQRLGALANVLTSEEVRSRTLAEAQAGLVSQYGLSQEIVDALRDGKVAADPWDVSAVWAAGADWLPVPVFQAYQAYTPGLDRLNAAHLADRPRLILQPVEPVSIDGRNPAWETPAFRRRVYCDYGVAVASGSWQVLEPEASSRCGPTLAISTHEAAASEAIRVPAQPDGVTLATIHPKLSMIDRLLGIIGMSTPIRVDYGGNSWRWAFGETAEGIMLNAPIAYPAVAGLPPEPHPTISVSVPATITFESMPVLKQ